MNSIIYASQACTACNEKPFERGERDVLMTRTEIICGTCGSVLQKYPPIASLEPIKGSISIPPAVSEVLARLLKQRLFIFDRGYLPRREDRTSPFDIERKAKTLAHRAGDQVYIELRGPSNTAATVRWSYSTKSLLPSYTWEEFDYKYGVGWKNDRRQKLELKPDLEKLDTPRPNRIVRACDALNDFQFTGLFIDKRWPEHKHLRFEKRIDLETQPLDTSEDVVLVVKAEFKWMQVGTSFPDESGPRVFNVSAMYQGYPMTLEEAVDHCTYAAMYDRQGNNHCIYHSRDRLHVVASVGNPLSNHYRTDEYSGQRRPKYDHKSWLTIRGNKDGYEGAFHLKDSKDPKDDLYLVPCDSLYDLEVWVPEGEQFRKDRTLPPVSVKITQGDQVIFENSFGGENPSKECSQTMYQIGYRCNLQEKLSNKPGETVVVSITNATEQTDTRTYKFVSEKEYETAWADLRNPIIDESKRATIAAAVYGLNCYWGAEHENTKFSEGEKVAAFFAGRWQEGRYAKAVGNLHRVIVEEREGKVEWEVSHVKSMADALSEGLYVYGPYTAGLLEGTQARCIGSVQSPQPLPSTDGEAVTPAVPASLEAAQRDAGSC